MSNPVTPQRFSGRAGSQSSGRLRRALDGAAVSGQRNGNTLEVATDGRLEVKLRRGSLLKQTRNGLDIDPAAVGDKNHVPINFIRDVPATATASDLVNKYNELLAELRRTKRMKGGL